MYKQFKEKINSKNIPVANFSTDKIFGFNLLDNRIQINTQRNFHKVKNTPQSYSDSSTVQMVRRNKGFKRELGVKPRRKDYKNERKRRSALKNQGEFVGDFSEHSGYDTQKSRHKWDKQLPVETKPITHGKTNPRKIYPRRDDNDLNMKPLPEGPVSAYRVEVEKFDERFSHLHMPKNERSKAAIYNPKPDVREYENIGKGKKTPKKTKDMAEYSRKFIESRKGQPSGTMSWINFGQPERALEFYKQKSTNPTEKKLGNKFSIKSFKIPHEVYDTLSEDTVHERQKKSNPGRPINVDRETPNQLGLQQAHLELLNETMLKGSAKVEDPNEFESRYGEQLKEIRRERKKAKKQHLKKPKNKSKNKHFHSKKANSISEMIKEETAFHNSQGHYEHENSDS